MKTRKVKPYGMLYSHGREYFLLQPFPLESDSWEWEGEHRQAFRFVVVPRRVITTKVLDKKGRHENIIPLNEHINVYPHARHIVTTSFNIEYADMPEILVKELWVEDVSKEEMNFETNKEQCKYE